MPLRKYTDRERDSGLKYKEHGGFHIQSGFQQPDKYNRLPTHTQAAHGAHTLHELISQVARNTLYELTGRITKHIHSTNSLRVHKCILLLHLIGATEYIQLAEYHMRISAERRCK